MYTLKFSNPKRPTTSTVTPPHLVFNHQRTSQMSQCFTLSAPPSSYIHLFLGFLPFLANQMLRSSTILGNKYQLHMIPTIQRRV
ncbi:hypothetical protein L2E82_44088 [Cichorium intybus]|uniref:Uncharacterized protein n=1 Tax=Cichorium intybus TaxID=13427 RepID=A0ACB8ZPN9_CICIN|nr:hypothetical protein L2E82_44088 [Cichorium intybus]